MRQVHRFLCNVNDELHRIHKIMDEQTDEMCRLKKATDIDDDVKKDLLQEVRDDRHSYHKDADALFKSLYDMNLIPEFVELFERYSDKVIIWLIDHNRIGDDQ